MGSGFFYLEFLLAWVSLLRTIGFRNPALFSLEYTLVPDAIYPTQLHETLAGYDYVLARVAEPSQVCLAGDSAGATLMLSLMLHLAKAPEGSDRRPGFATLISPWTTLVSPKNRNTPSDYLDAQALHLYAHQYIGPDGSLSDPVASPGTCKDVGWWRRAMPSKGAFILYGAEEVFAPEIRDLIKMMKDADLGVIAREEESAIHAWPVATLFLSSTRTERQKGLRDIAEVTWQHMS